MGFERTKRVTVRVGESVLPVWERAARHDLAISVNDWITELANRRARELRTEIEAFDKAELAAVRGPVRLRQKGGGR